MAKHSLDNIWNWDIGSSMIKDGPSLTDRVEVEVLPARVASLRELAALLAETSRGLRAAQRLVLCAATQIEKERRVSLAIGEAERERTTPILNERPVLSIRDVTRLLGVSRTTLYQWDRKGLFVRPVRLRHGGRKGYLAHEVEEWLRSKQTAASGRLVG